MKFFTKNQKQQNMKKVILFVLLFAVCSVMGVQANSCGFTDGQPPGKTQIKTADKANIYFSEITIKATGQVLATQIVQTATVTSGVTVAGKYIVQNAEVSKDAKHATGPKRDI